MRGFARSRDVIEDKISQFFRPRRKQIGAVQWHAPLHHWVFRTELCSEIEPLLLIWFAGGDFSSHRKVTAPGAPSADHGDLILLGFGQGKEDAAGTFQMCKQCGVDTVACRVEEATVTTGFSDRL